MPRFFLCSEQNRKILPILLSLNISLSMDKVPLHCKVSIKAIITCSALFGEDVLGHGDLRGGRRGSDAGVQHAARPNDQPDDRLLVERSLQTWAELDMCARYWVETNVGEKT